MSRSDLVADCLSIIKNAVMRGKKVVEIPGSNMLEDIVDKLRQEGFIKDYRVIEDSKQGILRLYLRYDSEGNSFISGLQRVSKPGRRVYKNAHEIPKVLNGLGISIITTSRGVLTDKEARKERVGGEVVCNIW